MNRFVIDASVVVKLFFEEEHSEIAAALIRDAREVLAPDFVYLETANVVLTRMKRDKLDLEPTQVTLKTLFALRISPHLTSALIPSAFEIAIETARSIYDCAYLALAIREECPLITSDNRFFNALAHSRFSRQIHLIGHVIP